jgi:Ni2+-binding GTPase involved in maturation of urease and hydrogenase
LLRLNEIQIDVGGLTGSGKSHVMHTIRKALESEYGCTVLSPNLDQELRMCSEEDLVRPNPEATVFWMNEFRVADYRVLKGLK